jgi:hypothetical protein
MTEHDLGFTEERRRAYWDACRSASTDRLLLVPGIEYGDSTNTVHSLVWGDVPFLGAGLETERLLADAVDKGGVCVFAHPSRRAAWKVFRQGWLHYLAGIEVWNRKTDGWSPSREAVRLIAESGAPPVVGLDFHSAKQFFPLAMCFTVDGRIEQRHILDALRRGTCRCEAFRMDLKMFTNRFGLGGAWLLEVARRLGARTIKSAFPQAFRHPIPTDRQPQKDAPSAPDPQVLSRKNNQS